jgi:ADP-ribosylation factor related protein 1
MISLISGFWDYFFRKPNIKVLIIGLDHAGKTTLLEKMKSQFGKLHSLPLEKIAPTVGMNLAKITYFGSQIILWDLGGQAKMRGIWEKYYDDADCVVFVVDSSDVGRLMEAKLALGNSPLNSSNELMRAHSSHPTIATTCDNDSLGNIPIIVLATKQDLPVMISVHMTKRQQ